MVPQISSSELHLQESQFYQQAAPHPAWQEVMLNEFHALEANQTWHIVPLSPHTKPIPCKWMYKIKKGIMGP